MKEEANIQRIKQRLARLMLLSIIITFSLFAIVIATIIYKLRHEASLNIIPLQNIHLEQNSQIISQSLNGQNISLLIKNNNGNQSLLIYNYKKAKILTHIKF